MPEIYDEGPLPEKLDEAGEGSPDLLESKKNVRSNPLKSLVKGLNNIVGSFSLKKPNTTYGLGALMPPREKLANNQLPKKIVKINPSPKAVTFIAPVKNRALFNNVFFETLLMLVIIFWLLKWLFGFTHKNL
ncbi:MAG: hypothetical protein VR72_10950 [Clostridiaceae bacterium BRH_c20a]|nr:MAG: hypothetical protein VR72_10950 [Clostridiaceae bacterium BRH_c20a]